MDYIKDTCPAAAPHVMTYIAQEDVIENPCLGMRIRQFLVFPGIKQVLD